MQKWTAVFFATLVLGTVALVIFPAGRHGASVGTSVSDAGAPDATDGDAVELTDASTTDADTAVESAQQADGGGTVLLSGEAPPGLAADAPKSVVFGVVLVTYRGAQGVLPTARTRDAALELVKQLAELAKTDFKAAVAKGDKGSMENAGRLPRGVLEPAPEYVLFSLPKGGVSEPVDTPRGYWIVQRIE